MRFQWFRLIAVPALAAGMAFAQTAPVPEAPANELARKQIRHRRARIAGRMSQALGLTDAQKQQAHSIRQEAWESARPLREQLRAGRLALRDAARANDNARIQELAAGQGKLQGELAAIRSTAFAKFYNTVLTPEQRTKVDQFRSRHQAG